MIPDERASGAQGWLLNTRREKFKDRRVREALAMVFDFEWTNKNYMYGSYERTHSVFQNSDMMANGKPAAKAEARCFCDEPGPRNRRSRWPVSSVRRAALLRRVSTPAAVR